jgi:hypothetical protein
LQLIKGIPRLDENGEIIGWIVEPDFRAIRFMLITKGKSRGWCEKLEVDITSNHEKIVQTYVLHDGTTIVFD